MILITGGSGSGKSAYGEKRILEAGEMTRYYIATMEVFGEEGRKKVERHKKLRQGKGFITIESPKDVGREKVLEMLRPDGQKKPFYWSVFLISQPMKCLVVPLKKDQNLADVQKHWQKKSALTSKRSIKQLAFSQ